MNMEICCLERKLSKGLEAAGGFEPPNEGFADLSLNHLGTPPTVYLYYSQSKGCFQKSFFNSLNFLLSEKFHLRELELSEIVRMEWMVLQKLIYDLNRGFYIQTRRKVETFFFVLLNLGIKTEDKLKCFNRWLKNRQKDF